MVVRRLNVEYAIDTYGPNLVILQLVAYDPQEMLQFSKGGQCREALAVLQLPGSEEVSFIGRQLCLHAN